MASNQARLRLAWPGTTAGRGWRRTLRYRVIPSDRFLLPVLVAAAVAIGTLSTADPDWCPPSILALPILVGGFLLRIRSQLVLVLATAGILAGTFAAHQSSPERGGSVLVVSATALLVITMSRMRVRLGVQGTRGESILFDLRERLHAQGRVPLLPSDWDLEMALRPARGKAGNAFAGDFLIAARSGNGRQIELGLVDVSGKGVEAGTRALQLSGAFGGLLGSVPYEAFLGAANKYLLRQGWEEGFATAVHIVISLDDGAYTFFNAGHPPIAQLISGSGQWELKTTDGPALGVIEDAVFLPDTGKLEPGDALMLFTDGLVEVPGQDLAVGLDKLLGAADSLVTRGFDGGAMRVVNAVARHNDDDRALVLLWRA